MTASTLVLLLGAGLQQPDVDRWIRELSDERLEIRAAAVAAIGSLDPAQLPDLRSRLQGLPPEARTRLAEAIGLIEEAARIRTLLPAWGPHSFSFVRTPIRKALEEWVSRTRLRTELDRVQEPREITLDITGATALEALDRICREAGASWDFRGEADWRGRLRWGPVRLRVYDVDPQRKSGVSTSYVRHYRIRPIKRNELLKQPAMVHLERLPGMPPHSTSGIRIVNALDAEGRPLALKPAGQGVFHTLSPFQSKLQFPLDRAFEPPLPDQLSKLSGTVTFRYPLELRWVRFELPATPLGSVSEGMGLRFVLTSYARKERSHSVGLSMTRVDGSPLRLDFAKNQPFSCDEFELLTQGGNRLLYPGLTAMGDQRGWDLQLDFHDKLAEEPAEFRIPWADRFLEDRVDFELRDVQLR